MTKKNIENKFPMIIGILVMLLGVGMIVYDLAFLMKAEKVKAEVTEFDIDFPSGTSKKVKA